MFVIDQIDHFTLLGWVIHARRSLILHANAALAEKTFAMLRFLVILDECAASAANGPDEVFDAVAFEVILFANRLALHRDGDTGTANAAGSTEQQALQ